MRLCPSCGGPPNTIKIGNLITWRHERGDVCRGCGWIWDITRRLEVDGTYDEDWRPPRADEALRRICEL